MVNTIYSQEEKPDAFLMNGDFIRHGVALHNETGDKDAAWSTIKQIMKDDLDIVRSKFPGTHILPAIGNNDVIVHDSMPCSDSDAEMYFSGLFDIWFPEGQVPVDFKRE